MKAVRLAAIAATTALVATACGGSSSSSKSSSGGSGGASAPGVTATSITIGSHQPLTGPAAPGYSEIAPASAAMFQYINSKGGVNGRTINYDYQDDAYNPSQTATVVRQLVEQKGVFGIFNGLGTPTHQQVEPFLNSNKVPDFFVASGCVCWNQPKSDPWTTGWQTNYAIEGRILGQYIAHSMAGQKVGYLLQNDDVGQGGKQGLDTVLPASSVVAQQNYDVSALTSGLGTQMTKLQQSGAKVVAVFAIPAAFALAILAAAQIGYHPTFVVSSIASDVPTMSGLLQSFSKGAASSSLLNGVLTATYLPTVSDTSNPWVALFKKIHDQYDTKNPFDGNTIYGMAVAYNYYQLLQKAGKNLTRQSMLAALNGASLQGPGLLPLTFSPTDHRGYEGEQMAKIDNGATTTFGPVYKATETGPITTYSGSQPAPPAGF